MTTDHAEGKPGIGQRFKQEMRTYFFISFYLWVCFSALLLYENSILARDNIAFLPMGTAAIKALILGKFILVGKAIGVGSRVRHHVLLHRILWKSLATLLLLLVFTGIEELVVGLVHGHALADTASEMLESSWLERLAPSVMMLLVLVPMIAFEELDIAIGKGKLRRLLLEPEQSNQAS